MSIGLPPVTRLLFYNLYWYKLQICVLWKKRTSKTQRENVWDTELWRRYHRPHGIKAVSPVGDLLFMWQGELCPTLVLCKGTVFRDTMIKAIIRLTWWAVTKENLLRTWSKVNTNQWRVFRRNQNCPHSEIRLSDSNCNKKFSSLLRWLGGEKHIGHKHDDINSVPKSMVKRENQLFKLKSNPHTCAVSCVVITHTNTVSLCHTHIHLEYMCIHTHTMHNKLSK